MGQQTCSPVSCLTLLSDSLLMTQGSVRGTGLVGIWGLLTVLFARVPILWGEGEAVFWVPTAQTGVFVVVPYLHHDPPTGVNQGH